MLQGEITAIVTEALKQLGITGVSISIERSSQSQNGDYSTNVAMILASKVKKQPRVLAQEIVEQMTKGQYEVFHKIEVAGPGFINFWVAEHVLLKTIMSDDLLQFPKQQNHNKVIVEYSSPNIAKPFTIGHLRSTIIGDAIANLLEKVGYTVYRDNHVGDWGTQFGKQIYAIKRWGNEEAIESAERPVKVLVDLYVKFHDEAEKDPTIEEEGRKWFKKLEDGDSEARRLWKKCIEWSWKEFDEIYKLLQVRFTENSGRGYGESFFEDKMDVVIEELQQKRLLKKGESGAQLIFYPQDAFPPLMILKQDGATLYSTRDLATDKFRKEQYGENLLIINEVGAEQQLYFRQLYKAEELLGWYDPSQRVHIRHGLYRFKTGKMSTRKGNVIWLEDVLSEASKKALTFVAKDSLLSVQEKTTVATLVGIGALKWNDLKRNAEQDISFDWDEILTMHGNSGPYVQYTYVRTKSVLAKNSEFTHKYLVDDKGASSLTDEERAVVRLLSVFSEVVYDAAIAFAPNVLCTYLFTLAQAYNSFYQACPILKANEQEKAFRVALTKRTGDVLKEGLSLLGIQAPEKM